MDIYLLRHAIAADRSDSGDDRERPLTPKGREKMTCIAEGMKSLGMRFDSIISSPYVRARETAEVVHGVYKFKRAIAFSQSLVPDVAPSFILRELEGMTPRLQTVLLVGHEPFLSRLAYKLINGRGGAWIQMKKGGLCKIAVESPTRLRGAVLEFLLTPKQLEAIGKA